MGFTLIELVVSIGILALIMLLASAIFSRNLEVQRRDIAQQELQEDVRFALELFSREARTSYGSTYALVDGSGSGIIMRNQAHRCVMYRVNKGTKQLERSEIENIGRQCHESDFSGKSFAGIHSPNTVFETLKFIATRTESNPEGLPKNQGLITIIAVAASAKQPDVNIGLQTSVTSRQTGIFEQP
ncbi:MAG: type II secretion system protein [Candidatus Andersenbacteria bacterium]|nr:type II secretion system protein [Candidatus Andersenbacteria bacterium]